MIPILLALALIALIFVIVVTGQPDEFVVVRSAQIPASPDRVFAHVNDLHKWETWSPWARLDPKAKNTFDGPPSGAGTSMKWEGNNKVGAGKMTITDSQPGQLVRFRLEFERPMKATNTAEFTFRPEGGQTVVTWKMAGQNSAMGKLFGLLMNCEKMCGDQFNQGLANLRGVVEKAG
jgi:uncharacterized protein YndB with AHSA1/START domain